MQLIVAFYWSPVPLDGCDERTWLQMARKHECARGSSGEAWVYVALRAVE